MPVTYSHRNGSSKPPTVEGWYWVLVGDENYNRKWFPLEWGEMIGSTRNAEGEWVPYHYGTYGWYTAPMGDYLDMVNDSPIHGPIPTPTKRGEPLTLKEWELIRDFVDQDVRGNEDEYYERLDKVLAILNRTRPQQEEAND